MAVDFEIDPDFRSLCPKLTDDEYRQLEANIVAEGEARDALCVWEQEQLLLDGHNRLEICERHNLPYEIFHVDLEDRDQAKLWIIDNQRGRRNLTPYQRCELEHVRESLLPGRPKGRPKADENSPTLADLPPTDRREEAASRAGVSHGTYSKSKVIASKATEEEKEELRRGDKTINEVHGRIRRDEARAEVIQALEAIEAKEAKALEGVYDTIVIDPPWPMQKIDRDVHPEQTGFDYPTMNEAELRDLHIPAANHCHIWVWTTQKYMPMSLRLIEHWGFQYICEFVWHKPGGFQPFGLPQYNCEFAVYCRKGSPQFVDTKAFPTCFRAERGRHSEKPEEFYQILRRVTAGRRLDMFNRRNIEGFDTWGKEA